MTMRRSDEIHAIAAQRNGGADAPEALVEKPIPREVLARCLLSASRSTTAKSASWDRRMSF
jgi:hypothetical protein